MLWVLRAYNVDVAFPSHALNTITIVSFCSAHGRRRPRRTLHPSHSFFTLLLTFIPLASSGVACLASIILGLLLSFPSIPVDHVHKVRSECAGDLVLNAVLALVPNARAAQAVHAAHIGRLVCNDVVGGTCRRDERLEKFLRAVITAFARRG